MTIVRVASYPFVSSRCTLSFVSFAQSSPYFLPACWALFDTLYQVVPNNASMSNSEWNDPEANVLPEKVEKLEQNGEIPKNTDRKRVVVVGLGMVGISFM